MADGAALIRPTLIEFWQQCDFANPPFAHPEDWPTLRQQDGRHIDEQVTDFHRFLSSPRFGDFKDTRFHLSLLPIPYGGNLQTADIVILLLNPGFTFSDYYAESCVPKFTDRLKSMLRQEFSDVEFPFIWLDPEFCWHGGFTWWERKLRGVISLIAEKDFDGRYLDALRHLSQRIAHVELCPYHSPSFSAHKLIESLPSVRAARRFAQESLTRDAQQGDKKIIITRQEASWKLPLRTDNIIVYRGGITRGASLGPDTPGGKAILARYGINR